MLIRHERAADEPAIRELLIRCFPEGNEAGLVDALRADGHVALSLVAEEDARILGHVLLSRMTAPASAVGLGPVATLPEAQGRGIASALVRRALDDARARGWQAVFVLGEFDFYGRFGFTPQATDGWASPYAGPYFLALELAPSALTPGGAAEYPPPFADL